MTSPDPTKEMNSLVARLNSRKPTIRKQALREASTLPPQHLAQLFTLETQRYRHKSAQNAMIQKVSLAATLLQAVCWWMTNLWPANAVAVAFRNNPALLIGILVLSWVGILFPFLLPQRARRQVATLLGQTEDVRLLDAVVSLATDNQADKAVATTGRQALKRLLLKWRADLDGPLTTAQLHALLIPLRSPYADPDLTLAILTVLGRAGDEQVLSIVTRLADVGAATEKMRVIKQAAQDCLVHLQQRLEVQKQSNTLLRAVTSLPSIQAKNLLRPAQPAVSSTAPGEMLRMVEPTEATVPTVELQQTALPVEEVVIRGT